MDGINIGVAAKTAVLGPNLFGAQREMVLASAAALAMLLVLTVLSVYKPWGLTPYGQRKQDEQRQGIMQEYMDSDAQAVPVN